MERLKIVSLFCGCGGTDLGMLGGFTYLGKTYAAHPLNIVYANDIDPAITAIFNSNFKLKAVVQDIREVKNDEIPKHDILTGGFPCQSFSIVAQNPPRLGFKDEKGRLFFEMCRILKNKKPKAFVAENVKGILSANSHQSFPLIIKEFEDCGYIVSHYLLNAADYGVPQRRERVFIVGIRKDIGGKFYPPDKTHHKENSLTGEKWAPLKKVILPHTKVPQKYFFSEKAHLGLAKANPIMNKGRAQNTESVCNTVGAHLAKVSLNSTDPVLKVNGRYRRFTPREIARIQSFPDSFKLNCPDAVAYKALGNAIPPVLMWHVTKRLLEVLKKLSVKDVRTDTEKRSHNMSRIRAKNTSIEKILNSELKNLSVKYRRNAKDLMGKPDIVFDDSRLAVFCDSEFWHGKDYPTCVNRIKTNRDFWIKKIQRNMERDKKVSGNLRATGWKVLRFWANDIKNNPQEILKKISRDLKQ
ncbi:MAG: DNA mismatch endonuclease Vsr [Spirochaetota bacterium]